LFAQTIGGLARFTNDSTASLSKAEFSNRYHSARRSQFS